MQNNIFLSMKIQTDIACSDWNATFHFLKTKRNTHIYKWKYSCILNSLKMRQGNIISKHSFATITPHFLTIIGIISSSSQQPSASAFCNIELCLSTYRKGTDRQYKATNCWWSNTFLHYQLFVCINAGVSFHFYHYEALWHHWNSFKRKQK